jgi:hypothetical protein
MKKSTLISLGISVSIVVLAAGVAISAQDKYTVQVPNGLAFSEFRGYEDWPVIAISENEGIIAVIVGNRAMIDAYKEGVPAMASLSQTAPKWRKFIGPEKTRDVPRSANRARYPA